MLALKLKTTRIILINNINVREAIVRPKGDKNFFQQHLSVRKKNNKNSYKKTTKTILGQLVAVICTGKR